MNCNIDTFRLAYPQYPQIEVNTIVFNCMLFLNLFPLFIKNSTFNIGCNTELQPTENIWYCNLAIAIILYGLPKVTELQT